MSKPFTAFRPLVCFFLLFLFQSPIVAQETAIQSTKPARITINGINPGQIPEIYVTVNVTDDFGRSLRNLQREDFTLIGQLANLGHLTAVENITDDDLSYSVVLALDISTSMSGQPIAALKEAAKIFLEIIGENDPVALLTFDQEIRIVQDFTVDKTALRAAIDALEAGGQTALYQAGLAAVELAANAPTPRRAVVILSDGHEYGNASEAAREDAKRASLIRGVPVYTIGLGYDQVDRDYLKELAAAGFGIFSESPTPEELVQRYSDFALLFRSQYILTIEANLPLDGQLYSLGVALGTAVESELVSLRTPIPVPIISLASENLSQPIAEATEFRFSVTADDPLQEVRLNLDGIHIPTRMEGGEYSATLHPIELLPGAHELEISARDEDGDSAEFNLPFVVAALPPEITLESPLLQDPLLAETTALSVTAGGQTPFAGAKIILDGITQTSSNEEPSLLLDPYAFQPGPHELQFVITNEAGQSASTSIPFEVPALPPIFRLEGLSNRETLSDFAEIFVDLNKSQAGGDIQSRYRVNDAPAIPLVGDEGVTLSANELPPGTNRLTITIEDSNTGLTSEQTIQFEVPTLKPEVQISGLAEGDTLREDRTIDLAVESQTEVLRAILKIDGEEVQRRREPPYQFDLGALDLPPGEHTAEIQVVNEGLREEIEVIPFTVAAEPAQTATAIALASTAQAQSAATERVRATATQQAVQLSATASARATEQPNITTTARAAATATQQARATAIQQSVVQAVEVVRATQQARVTATQRAAATATQQIRATATQQAVQLATTATQQARATATQQTRATATQQAVQLATTTTQQARATATQQARATATQQIRATATQQAVQLAATVTQQARATATQQAAQLATTATQQARATATQQARATATQQIRATATQQAVQLAATATQQTRATATQQAAQLATTATQQARAAATQQAHATATQQIRATATQQAVQLAATATQQARATATQQALQIAATATQQAQATATQQAHATATQQIRATATQQAAQLAAAATQQTRATATQQIRATATQQAVQLAATATQQARATATQQAGATATQQVLQLTATQQAAQLAATATQQTQATATQQAGATATQQVLQLTATQQTAQLAATATQQVLQLTATQQTAQLAATATQQVLQLTATQQAAQLAATAAQQARATATQQIRATATQQARATATQQVLQLTATQQTAQLAATATQQASTATPIPSPTPRPTLAEIEVAPPSEPADNTPILVTTIIVILLLSAAFYLLRNRGNRN